jgi:hypothetical protein
MAGEPFGDEDDRAWPGEAPDQDVDWDAELAELLRQHAGDGWGGGDGPEDGVEEDWETAGPRRRRRPAAVRVAAAVIAASLLFGVVGGTIGVILDDGPPAGQEELSATVKTLGPTPATNASERVVFALTNNSPSAVRPLCTVLVFGSTGAQIGEATYEARSDLAAGATQRWTMDVPLTGHTFSGGQGHAKPICSVS